MAEEEKKEEKKLTPQERIAKLKESSKKQDDKEIIKQVATRNILERDYVDDTVEVIFSSTPGVKRKVRARKPNFLETIDILKLSAAIGEMTSNPGTTNWDKIEESYRRLPELAAQLCIDEKLDADFWSNKQSFAALQTFVTELVVESQQDIGGITRDDLESFREE